MVKEWSKNPLMFYSEHDVQAEVFCRLKGYLQLKGLLYVYGLKEPRDEKCAIENAAGQKWRRLHCEVHLKCKDPSRGIKPDVIIWDDLTGYNIDKKTYLDIVYEFKNNWPMIWACEIKYYHSGARQVDNYEFPFDEHCNAEQRKDFNNMKYLLDQGYNKDSDGLFGTRYATIINIYRRKGKGDSEEIKDRGKDGSEETKEECYVLNREVKDKCYLLNNKVKNGLTIINAFLPEKEVIE